VRGRSEDGGAGLPGGDRRRKGPSTGTRKQNWYCNLALRADKKTHLAMLADCVLAKSIKGRWVMKALVRVILAVGILAAWSKGDFVLVWILALVELAMMKTVLLAVLLMGIAGVAFGGFHSKADYVVVIGGGAIAVYLHFARHRGWLLLRPSREV
jgi:hypothetical protein